MEMGKNTAIVLIVIVILAFSWVIADTIVNPRIPERDHVDWFCGTITAKDGTVEPIKISVGTEMSFDLRESPGKLELYRCTSGK